jgi:hypothetical protein
MPSGIVPSAVYDRAQVCSVLSIGDTKLRELVKDGALHPLTFTTHWRFLGEDLIRLCRAAAQLPDPDYTVYFSEVGEP